MSERTGFGAALAQARMRAGLSQNQLAHEAGYDHSYVCRLEAAKREPSRAAVAALAMVLGLDEYDTGRLHLAAGYVPPGPGWFVVFERQEGTI